LNKVTVTDGLATVDFSKEFKALENSGEAKGSIAMKAILSSLEQFPTIKLVSITVDGVTFADSAVGKWENLPVRTDAPPNEAPK